MVSKKVTFRASGPRNNSGCVTLKLGGDILKSLEKIRVHLQAAESVEFSLTHAARCVVVDAYNALAGTKCQSTYTGQTNSGRINRSGFIYIRLNENLTKKLEFIRERVQKKMPDYVNPTRVQTMRHLIAQKLETITKGQK
jgi:ribosomal protein L29